MAEAPLVTVPDVPSPTTALMLRLLAGKEAAADTTKGTVKSMAADKTTVTDSKSLTDFFNKENILIMNIAIPSWQLNLYTSLNG